MKVYRVTVYDKDEGQMLAWFSSRREATKHFNAQQPDDPQGPCGVEEVDIPTDRQGLLTWLNAHFTTNNG